MKYIGVFDSGVGGLTVVKTIKKSLKNESIVFLADNKNMPYGSKTKKQLISYSRNNMRILSNYDLKAVVIACNTSDSLTKDSLLKKYDLPFIGVIESTVKKAIKTTKNNKIGLIATVATCNSKKYESLIKKYNSDIKVYTKPSPDLVPLIEADDTLENKEKLNKALIKYVKPLVNKDIDTLILGCTHYDLIKKQLKDLYPNINIISSSVCLTQQLKKTLKDNNLLSKSKAKYIYLTTKNSKTLTDNARKIIKDITFKEK